jgi:hypothetical protein
MSKPRTIAAVLLATALAFALSGFAQESQKPALKQEVIKLKYVTSNQILTVLYAFLSPQGRLNPSPDMGLVTVSDYPQNVEKILSVIREIDVKPADIQFTVQLVVGSTMSAERPDDATKDDPVIKELRQMLKFKTFSLLDTSYVRALDRSLSQVSMGRSAELRLDLTPKCIKEDKEDLIQVEATLYRIGASQVAQVPGAAHNQVLGSRTLVSSNFTLKSGEKTVVGVSKMDGGDSALILIISGKILK